MNNTLGRYINESSFNCHECNKHRFNVCASCPQAGKKKFSTPAPDERRKGVPWSEEEHRLFLQGLEIYGKGDWRSISRKCVLTRNPTQVRAVRALTGSAVQLVQTLTHSVEMAELWRESLG